MWKHPDFLDHQHHAGLELKKNISIFSVHFLLFYSMMKTSHCFWLMERSKTKFVQLINLVKGPFPSFIVKSFIKNLLSNFPRHMTMPNFSIVNCLTFCSEGNHFRFEVASNLFNSYLPGTNILYSNSCKTEIEVGCILELAFFQVSFISSWLRCQKQKFSKKFKTKVLQLINLHTQVKLWTEIKYQIYYLQSV